MRNDKGQFVKGHPCIPIKNKLDWMQKVIIAQAKRRGRPFSATHLENMSKCKLGKKRGPHSVEWRANITKGLTGKTSQKASDAKKGAKNPMWEGGLTPFQKLARGVSRYAKWRKQVIERDNSTCQFCLKQKLKLEADHIVPFAYAPEKRFLLENGRTLCQKCHTKTATYGGRIQKSLKEITALKITFAEKRKLIIENTKKQLQELQYA